MNIIKTILIFGNILIFTFRVSSQEDMKIRNISWPEGNNILVTMENDSGFSLGVNELFHYTSSIPHSNETGVTYYPVVLADNFITQLKEKNVEIDTSAYIGLQGQKKHNTLWSAIHGTLGGGWVHFANCLAYGLETGQLQLDAPLLKRPESKWKPKPMTATFKRTQKWKYYIPESQKLARKEFKIKEKENSLGDISNLPQQYIDLFLETNDKEYRAMRLNGDFNSLAKIDMVKILLGANYLGIPQIHYIKSMVLKSVLNYSIKNPIPSIIVFDDLQAAVSMNLDTYGYHIDNVAFKNQESLSQSQIDDKMKFLTSIVSGINKVNNRLLEEKLEKHYE